MTYTTYIITNQPERIGAVRSSLQPEPLQHFDGSGYPSFAQLVNACAAAAPTEKVVIMSDKVLPKASDVARAVDLLDQGYGFVGLYRFAFFALTKQLFSHIGPLDERFRGGGYEDDDYYIRLKEANIAAWIDQSVDYVAGPSGWDYTQGKEHFVQKWLVADRTLTRKLAEEHYLYDWGQPLPQKWLPAEDSFIIVAAAIQFTYGRKIT